MSGIAPDGPSIQVGVCRSLDPLRMCLQRPHHAHHAYTRDTCLRTPLFMTGLTPTPTTTTMRASVSSPLPTSSLSTHGVDTHTSEDMATQVHMSVCRYFRQVILVPLLKRWYIDHVQCSAVRANKSSGTEKDSTEKRNDETKSDRSMTKGAGAGVGVGAGMVTTTTTTTTLEPTSASVSAYDGDGDDESVQQLTHLGTLPGIDVVCRDLIGCLVRGMPLPHLAAQCQDKSRRALRALYGIIHSQPFVSQYRVYQHLCECKRRQGKG